MSPGGGAGLRVVVRASPESRAVAPPLLGKPVGTRLSPAAFPPVRCLQSRTICGRAASLVSETPRVAGAPLVRYSLRGGGGGHRSVRCAPRTPPVAVVCSGWAGDAVVRTVIFPSVYNSRGASVAVGHRLRDRSCGFYCGQRPQVRKQHGVPRNRDGLQRHRARSRRKQERGVFDGQGPGPHSSGGRHVAVGLVEGTPSARSTPGGKPAALRLLPLAEDEPPPTTLPPGAEALGPTPGAARSEGVPPPGPCGRHPQPVLGSRRPACFAGGTRLTNPQAPTFRGFRQK